MKQFRRFEEKIIIYLSHRPRLYALIVGIGIVLFWRGVWHSTDYIHFIFNSFHSNLTTDLTSAPWWDGPLSFIVGTILLYFTGAFTSSFIGNELILSGLRGEKKLNQKTEVEVKSEVQSILEIKDGLENVSDKIKQLEKKLREYEDEKK